MKKLIIGIFFSLCFLYVIVRAQDVKQHFGKELKCYQCDSASQPKCRDFFDNRTVELTPCPDDGKNYTRCRKIIQEMYFDGTWEVRYYRDCAVTGVIGAEDGRWCQDRVGVYRVKMRYCHCNIKDGCNSAHSHTVSQFLRSIPWIVALGIISRFSLPSGLL